MLFRSAGESRCKGSKTDLSEFKKTSRIKGREERFLNRNSQRGKAATTMGRPKRRRGDAAKNPLSLNGSRDVNSKILAKLREVERQKVSKNCRKFLLFALRINLVSCSPTLLSIDPSFGKLRDLLKQYSLVY